MSRCNVRAIVLSGFPMNIRERETYNLLWALPAFFDSWLKIVNDRPICVARFLFHEAAIDAVRYLQNHLFDEGFPLKCDLATFNPQPGESVPMHAINFSPPTRTSRSNYRYYPRPSSGSNNQSPSRKLFIGRLSPCCLQKDLEEELKQHAGYLKMRFILKNEQALAFADFVDVHSAQKCVDSYSNSGGIRLPSSSKKGFVTFVRFPNRWDATMEHRHSAHKRARVE